MELVVLRERLHDYINTADEQHLTAIYTLVEDKMAGEIRDSVYNAETMEMLYRRRENHRNGTSKSYTAEEMIRLARQKNDL